MWPIITDRLRRLVWSVCLSVSQSVSQSSVTIVSPAKTAEPVEMPFGLWTLVVPRNHLLDGGAGTPWKGVILKGRGAAHCKV